MDDTLSTILSRFNSHNLYKFTEAELIRTLRDLAQVMSKYYPLTEDATFMQVRNLNSASKMHRCILDELNDRTAKAYL